MVSGPSSEENRVPSVGRLRLAGDSPAKYHVGQISECLRVWASVCLRVCVPRSLCLSASRSPCFLVSVPLRSALSLGLGMAVRWRTLCACAPPRNALASVCVRVVPKCVMVALCRLQASPLARRRCANAVALSRLRAGPALTQIWQGHGDVVRQGWGARMAEARRCVALRRVSPCRTAR